MQKKLYLCSGFSRSVIRMMKLSTAIYRALSWLRHQLTARNTGGHGIHSPYLFEWVRMVLHDENVYYAWEKIEEVRTRMLADEREVAFVDYGSGGKRKSENGDGRKVCDIAKWSLAKRKYAQMMARLVNWLGTSNSLNIVHNHHTFLMHFLRQHIKIYARTRVRMISIYKRHIYPPQTVNYHL